MSDFPYNALHMLDYPYDALHMSDFPYDALHMSDFPHDALHMSYFPHDALHIRNAPDQVDDKKEQPLLLNCHQRKTLTRLTALMKLLEDQDRLDMLVFNRKFLTT
ncbi:unnamed protein product, partial [Timema podura]|nr:unnamed protein product [Timema podura]